MRSGMWVASASTWTVGVLGDDQGLGGGVADEVDRDVDGDLLAAADGDEVDVLEDPADRVDLDLLGQRELRRAVDVELEQRVGAAVLERHHRVVARAGSGGSGRCRGRRRRRGSCRRGGSGGRHPCRTRCGSRR